jgi:hypothetical protein
MYQHYQDCLSLTYKYCIAEIATKNKQSLEAHEAVGFVTVQGYVAEEDDAIRWEWVLWDWGPTTTKPNNLEGEQWFGLEIFFLLCPEDKFHLVNSVYQYP